jgi:phosphotransferase system HPr-like phosphotransfer protein
MSHVFTATLHLSEERNNALSLSLPVVKLKNRFQSRITVQRGDSRPFDISVTEQLRELAANKSNDLRIVIEGSDEMQAACRVIDFFNHGSGI